MGGSVVRNPAASIGDMGLIPDPERSHVLLEPGSHDYCTQQLLKPTCPKARAQQQVKPP